MPFRGLVIAEVVVQGRLCRGDPAEVVARVGGGPWAGLSVSPDLVEEGPAFTQAPTRDPEIHQRHDDHDRLVDPAVAHRPRDGGVEIGRLVVVAAQHHCPRRTVHLLSPGQRPPREVLEQRCTKGVGVGPPRQPRPGERAQGAQQDEPHPHSRLDRAHQAQVQQLRDRVQHVGQADAHRLQRLQREAALEESEPVDHLPGLRTQTVVGQLQSRLEPVAEGGDVAGQGGGELRRCERPTWRGGQLDGERYPVEQLAQGANVGVAPIGATHELGEHRCRLGRRERRYVELAGGGRSQWCPAGDQQSHDRGGVEDLLGQLFPLRAQFEVVDHHETRVHQRRERLGVVTPGQPEGDLTDEPIGIEESTAEDEESMGEHPLAPPGHLGGHPALAASGRPHESHETCVGVGEGRRDSSDQGLAAERAARPGEGSATVAVAAARRGVRRRATSWQRPPSKRVVPAV